MFELILYISGDTESSVRARRNIRAILSGPLESRVALEVVDVYADPARAEMDRILVTPTLLRRQPLPSRRVVGDLSERGTVLAALGLIDASDDGDASYERSDCK